MSWRLDHVNLRTAQLEAMRAFYVDVLGLEDGPRPPFGHPGAWLYAGSQAVVHLWLGSPDDTEAPPTTREPQLSHFAFAADDEKAFITRLDRAGVPFERHGLPGRDVVQIKLRDPDGNALHVDFPTAGRGESTGANGR